MRKSARNHLQIRVRAFTRTVAGIETETHYVLIAPFRRIEQGVIEHLVGNEHPLGLIILIQGLEHISDVVGIDRTPVGPGAPYLRP